MIIPVAMMPGDKMESYEEFLRENPEEICSGTARCFSGTVTEIVDGDTIKIDGQSVRFALASAPELDELGGLEARELNKIVCPVGSVAIVDEDDGQTEGSFGRIIAVVYCTGANLNALMLQAGYAWLDVSFCGTSEFSDEDWAQKNGCETLIQQEKPEPLTAKGQCEIAGGLWGIWGNQVPVIESCNPSTSDGGMECSDSSQCQSFCQAKEGAQIGTEDTGMCYGYELAICMQEVRNGMVDPEWCQ